MEGNFSIVERFFNEETGLQTGRGIGWSNEDGFVVLDLCECDDGVFVTTCHECGSDFPETCSRCGGKGYLGVVHDTTPQEQERIEELKLQESMNKRVRQIVAQKPMPLEKFADDREALLSSLSQLGGMMYKDVILGRWPFAVREQVFKHFVEGLFHVLGGSPPKDFYSVVLPELSKELKPINEVIPKTEKKSSPKRGKKSDDEQNDSGMTLDDWAQDDES